MSTGSHAGRTLSQLAVPGNLFFDDEAKLAHFEAIAATVDTLTAAAPPSQMLLYPPLDRGGSPGGEAAGPEMSLQQLNWDSNTVEESSTVQAPAGNITGGLQVPITSERCIRV